MLSIESYKEVHVAIMEMKIARDRASIPLIASSLAAQPGTHYTVNDRGYRYVIYLHAAADCNRARMKGMRTRAASMYRGAANVNVHTVAPPVSSAVRRAGLSQHHHNSASRTRYSLAYVLSAGK